MEPLNSKQRKKVLERYSDLLAVSSFLTDVIKSLERDKTLNTTRKDLIIPILKHAEELVNKNNPTPH